MDKILMGEMETAPSPVNSTLEGIHFHLGETIIQMLWDHREQNKVLLVVNT
jgi:hypothetical protein